MRLVLLTVSVAIVVGLIAGRTLREFPTVRLRWAWLALAGVVLQFLPTRGTGAFAILLSSFAVLLVFAILNLRAPGFILIATGLCLNVLVIAVNRGMPVTREALVDSNQVDTLTDLVQHGGAKHRLAGDDTVLLPLADVIGIGEPVNQALSVGDVCVHLGVGWFIVVAMQPRRLAPVAPNDSTTSGVAA